MRASRKIISAIAVLLAPLFASGQTSVRWPAGGVISDAQLEMFGGADNFFFAEELSDETFVRIDGVSYARGCTTPRSGLRHLQILHRNFGGRSQAGELICADVVAGELLAIFRELYDAGYPIEKVFLVDEYGADDNLSMADNNTACFNFRRVAGSKTLSMHASGLAVDINPLYNPCVKGSSVSPSVGAAYADRSKKCPYYIRKGDVCHRAFTRRGWKWGGAWRSVSDYQHFEKTN